MGTLAGKEGLAAYSAASGGVVALTKAIGRRPDIVVPPQKPGLLIGGLPIAMVGFARRRADNHDSGLGRMHDDQG